MRSTLVRIAADVQVVDRHVLDDVVGIDDERRAECHAFLRVADAELVDKRAGHVGELPVIEARQVAMVAPPAELRELVVGRAAEHDGVAVLANSLASLAKPTISVGHTNVKSFG